MSFWFGTGHWLLYIWIRSELNPDRRREKEITEQDGKTAWGEDLDQSVFEEHEICYVK